MRHGAKRLWALAISLGPLACGGDKAPPPAAQAVKKPEPVVVATVPDGGMAAAAPYVYSYNPSGKRDPFRSAVEEGHAPLPDSTVCKEALCQWDLDQLNLVGVVTGDANPLAMVEDPQGRGHILRRSSRIGKQGGKVMQILRDSVIVSEQLTTPDGKPSLNQITMRMRADKTFAPIVDLSTGRQY